MAQCTLLCLRRSEAAELQPGSAHVCSRCRKAAARFCSQGGLCRCVAWSPLQAPYSGTGAVRQALKYDPDCTDARQQFNRLKKLHKQKSKVRPHAQRVPPLQRIPSAQGMAWKACVTEVPGAPLLTCCLLCNKASDRCKPVPSVTCACSSGAGLGRHVSHLIPTNRAATNCILNVPGGSRGGRTALGGGRRSVRGSRGGGAGRGCGQRGALGGPLPFACQVGRRQPARSSGRVRVRAGHPAGRCRHSGAAGGMLRLPNTIKQGICPASASYAMLLMPLVRAKQGGV